MRKSVLTAVVAAHDKVDVCRDDDWVILGERLLEGILDDDEYSDAYFNEAQKAAIIAACRETFYAAAVISRAYAYQTAEIVYKRSRSKWRRYRSNRRQQHDS